MTLLWNVYWNFWRVFILRWAFREISPLHPDLPTMRIEYVMRLEWLRRRWKWDGVSSTVSR